VITIDFHKELTPFGKTLKQDKEDDKVNMKKISEGTVGL